MQTAAAGAVLTGDPLNGLPPMSGLTKEYSKNYRCEPGHGRVRLQKARLHETVEAAMKGYADGCRRDCFDGPVLEWYPAHVRAHFFCFIAE